MCQMPAVLFNVLRSLAQQKVFSDFWLPSLLPSTTELHNPATTTMYLMYYLNDKGDRVYTLKVRSCLNAPF